MRLTEVQAAAIKSIIREALGAEAQVWLFGSRVDDERRGGDIDLYVESKQACGLAGKINMMTAIQLAIGMRKIDLIVNGPGAVHKAIYDTARDGGTKL